MSTKGTHISQWEKSLAFLRDNLSAEQFNAWFDPIVATSFEEGILKLQVPSQFFIEAIEGRFFNLFSAALRKSFGGTIKNVLYTIDYAGEKMTIEQMSKSSIVAEDQKRRDNDDRFASRLNPYNTFANYCKSHCNELAVSVANAIVDEYDNRVFNPFFLFGPTGVGKTHLIQAIGIKILERFPSKKVLYITAREFEQQYVNEVAAGCLPDFIRFYQNIDVLILDDVQELAGKKGTQNAFYHIFNELQVHDRKIIMSSDRRPSDMDGFTPRMLSRLKWGMTVELSKPDLDLRRDVLSLKAAQNGLSMPTEVIDFIVANVTENVRELEGVVRSIYVLAINLSQEITVDLARTVVGNIVRINKRELTFELIAETIAEMSNVDLPLIYGVTRKREVSDARQLLMYFAKKETSMSSTAIGLRLDRNHATVLHAIKQIEQRMSIERSFAEEVAKIHAKLKSL